MSREHGFTLVELMISMTVTLIAVAAALTTFSQGLIINDSGTQLSDANQNLRAGANQLMQDVMQAGRIIGGGGIPIPTGLPGSVGVGVTAYNRPGPVGSTLTFNLVVDANTTLNIPSISSGYQLGPTVIGEQSDMITIMTVDEFMPSLQTPPLVPATPTTGEGTIARNGQSVVLPATSVWLTGDTVNDTPVIRVGDLVLFTNPNGMALHTITSTDATHIFFATGNSNDWFGFNQFNAPCVPMLMIKTLPPNPPSASCANDTTTAYPQTTMFRALMITYYVDNSSGTPLLTRIVNHCLGATNPCPGSPFTPQALSGVVEDLNFTYDLVDSVTNPANVLSLPCPTAIELVCGTVTPAAGVTYNSNQIRKVNVHMGVRSEVMSKPLHDYIRNHVNTAVDVRSLASVDRYDTTQ
jgi:prepilin-type N-terminal cleavage/methylation domain-containing protein